MNAGLELFNEGGAVQLDKNFFNFEFKAKKTFACAAGRSSVVAGQREFDNEMVAVGDTGDGYAQITRNADGLVFLHTIMPTARNVTLYFFGNPQASTSAVGFQLFNESGALTFCATQRYMRVVHSFKAADTIGASAANGVTLAAGSYAAISSSRRFHFQLYTGTITQTTITTKKDMVKVNGAYIEASVRDESTATATTKVGSAFTNTVGGWVTVINVAGL